MAQLDDAAQPRIQHHQALQRVVQRRQLVVGLGDLRRDLVQRDQLRAAAALLGLELAGIADQAAPHQEGHQGVEVPPVLQAQARVGEEAQVHLMHQRCGLQEAALGLLAHGRAGDAAHLVVDQR